jgi:hypothetical protein
MGVRALQTAQPPVAEVAPISARVAMGPCLVQAVPRAEAAAEAAVLTERAAMGARGPRLPLARPPAGTTVRANREATQPAAERARAEAPRRVAAAVLRLRAVPAAAAQARVLCLATSSRAPGARFARRGPVNVRPVAPFAVEYVWSLLICRPIPPIVGRRVAVLPVGRERLVPRAFAVARPRGKRLVLEDASTYRPIPRTAANAQPCAPAGSVRRGSAAR